MVGVTNCGSSTNCLANRLQNGEETISFDKDGDDTLDFVTAASNLRSSVYGIENKTRWEIKGSRFLILCHYSFTQHKHRYGRKHHSCNCYHQRHRAASPPPSPQVTRQAPERVSPIQTRSPTSTISLSKPNDQCGICRDMYTLIRRDPSRAKLGEVVKGLLGDDDRKVSVYEGQRVLSDPDWDDNHE